VPLASRRQRYDELDDDAKRTGRRPAAPRFAAEALFAPRDKPQPPLTEKRVLVRWYSQERGFGFCRLPRDEDNTGDFFLPKSAAGDADLPAGATLVVRVAAAAAPGKCPVIVEILSLDKSTVEPARAPRPPLVASRVECGRLLSRAKAGHGYMQPDSAGGNIYLPSKRFGDPGMEGVQPGDALEADVAIGSWGPIAVRIRRI
jgi:cold shock CspA family protein